jgi:hypothetical protein
MSLRPRLRRGRFAALSTAALILGTLGGPFATTAAQPNLSAQGLTPSGRVEAFKSTSAKLARTDPQLLARNDGAPVQVLIKLDQDAIASYTGGVAGYAATSPRVTGKPIGRTPEIVRYDAWLQQQQSTFVGRLQAAVPNATVGTRLRTVYGGVAARIPANSVEKVLAIPGAVAVQEDDLAQPLTDSSPDFVSATPLYPGLGGTANAGTGVIYGNLDTGIWPEHPSFADQGNLAAPPGPARECNYGDNPLTPAPDVFVCQHKLIGGAHFTDGYDACAAAGDCIADPYAGTARDGDGHGTHTSSTSAGNVLASAPVFGVERGPIHGLAPGAWVMEYKVCGPEGCFDSDTAAAVQQAIVDGVKVINFSISGGTDPFNDPTELAFLDAYAAGVFVATSAGNEGPGAGTVNHLSPWVTTVAASTQTREFATDLTLTANNGDTFTAEGASITGGAGPLPVVLAQNVPGYTGGAGCATLPSSPTVFDGMIVACQRGGQARAWKGFVVFSGGGEGMVLYNPTLADTETDNHWLPTVHLADGTAFLAFMNDAAHAAVTGSFPQGEAQNGQGDVMAAFSSRGPGGNFIKPDVTAPGVQILAGNTPTPPAPDTENGAGPPGEYFQAIAGTSMSSPHVAGAALLLRAAHPTWTPGQIKSSLMTRSTTSVLKEDLTTPADPFDLGAGRIVVSAASSAPLTLDESAARYAAMAGDPLTAVHLNVPSINAPVLPGILHTTRTVKNVTGSKQKIRLSASAPAGTTITFSPSKFNLAAGASRTFTVTISTDAPIGDQQFARINIQSNGATMHLPVAFIHTQGEVSLDQSCDDASIAKEAITNCTIEATNNAFESQEVDLDSSVNNKLTIRSATGAIRLSGSKAQLHNVVLGPATLGVPSVDPGDSPAGYLPLDLFGTTPIPIGDEEIINFNVPAYLFNGQTYNRIGVDSNGYLVAGGGSSQDNNCCNLPTGPSAAAPNNMLAPFWTDLDGTGAPGILAGVLTDGTNVWVVIEWRVNVFGTTSLRTFQTWIGVNGVQDISFTYAAAQTAPGIQDYLVGAENPLGQGDVSRFLPGPDDLVVTSTAPGSGGSATYSLEIRGKSVGLGVLTTQMEATGVPGITVVKDEIQVTRH